MSMPKLPNEDLINEFVRRLRAGGEDRVFATAVAAGIMNAASKPNPEIELLDTAEAFFRLYRRTGEVAYFSIGKAIRRAAHKVYREFLKINPEKEINMRFLNIVR